MTTVLVFLCCFIIARANVIEFNHKAEKNWPITLVSLSWKYSSGAPSASPSPPTCNLTVVSPFSADSILFYTVKPNNISNYEISIPLFASVKYTIYFKFADKQPVETYTLRTPNPDFAAFTNEVRFINYSHVLPQWRDISDDYLVNKLFENQDSLNIQFSLSDSLLISFPEVKAIDVKNSTDTPAISFAGSVLSTKTKLSGFGEVLKVSNSSSMSVKFDCKISGNFTFSFYFLTHLWLQPPISYHSIQFLVFKECKIKTYSSPPTKLHHIQDKSNEGITLTFEQPIYTGGSEVKIDLYRIEISEIPLNSNETYIFRWKSVYEGPETTVLISDVIKGKHYAFRAYAHNSQGWSIPSPSIFVQLPEDTPICDPLCENDGVCRFRYDDDGLQYPECLCPNGYHGESCGSKSVKLYIYAISVGVISVAETVLFTAFINHFEIPRKLVGLCSRPTTNNNIYISANSYTELE